MAQHMLRIADGAAPMQMIKIGDEVYRVAVSNGNSVQYASAPVPVERATTNRRKATLCVPQHRKVMSAEPTEVANAAISSPCEAEFRAATACSTDGLYNSSEEEEEDQEEEEDVALLKRQLAEARGIVPSQSGYTSTQMFVPFTVQNPSSSQCDTYAVPEDQSSSRNPPEVTMKRQYRLYKNREAAKECRRKKKDYVHCLENRVAVLENQNKTLIAELKSLKELYCRKDK